MLTGFPWNAFGYALTSPLALAQSASLIGIWGLTFLAIVDLRQSGDADRRPHRNAAGRGCRSRWRSRVLAGAWRLRRVAARSHADALSKACKLRIMQPNLQQDVRFNYAPSNRCMDRYVALSDRATGPHRTACATPRI